MFGHRRTRTRMLVSIFVMGLIVAVIGAALVVSHQDGHPSPVRVAYLPITVYLPLYVAEERGYFAEQGLEVELTDLTISLYVIDASLSDRADVICGSLPELLTTEQNAPGQFRIFMVFVADEDNPVDYVLVRTDSSLSSLADLRGGRMAVFPGRTNLLFVQIMLRSHIPVGEVVLTQDIPPVSQIDALVSGQVDAIYTLDPIATIAIENGLARPLVTGVRFNYVQEAQVGGAIAFSSRFLEEHPDLAAGVVTALEQAVDYTRNYGGKARMLLPLYTSTPPEIAPLINPAAIWKLSEIDRQSVQALADMLYREGFLDQPVDTEHMYYSR